ncbi:MAG: MBL fold metallo-hydrolase, partial [Pseudomonadota bacterium]
MRNPKITRRSALTGAAALPLAAGLSTTAARADGHAAAKSAIHNTFARGDFTVSTLLAGTRPVGDIQTIFGMNVTPEEFASVSEQNFLPTDQA